MCKEIRSFLALPDPNVRSRKERKSTISDTAEQSVSSGVSSHGSILSLRSLRLLLRKEQNL